MRGKRHYGDCIELIQPSEITDPHQPGRMIKSWTTPVVADIVRGSVQPASKRALERAGLLGKVNIKSVYCKPLGANPEGRLRIDGVMYRVINSPEWDTHDEILIEAL